MTYTIVVDKQPRTNPTLNKREYNINIDGELLKKGDICDELLIKNGYAQLIKKIAVNKYHITTILPKPIIKDLGYIDIELFEGENYIYLKDLEGNSMHIEYLVKNDFTESYATKVELNSAIKQSAFEINLSVDKKIENMTTEEEMKAAIEILSDTINFEVSKKLNKDEFSTQLQIDYESVRIAWNTISEFIQFINGQLQIKNSNKKLLMALAKDGQHFYKNNGNEIGKIGLVSQDGKNYLTFSLKAENTNDRMAWGIEINGKFYSVFELTKFGTEGGSYGGILTMISMLYMSNNPIKLMDSYLYGDIMNTVEFSETNNFNVSDTNGKTIFRASQDGVFGDNLINTSNIEKMEFYEDSGLLTLKTKTGTTATFVARSITKP